MAWREFLPTTENQANKASRQLVGIFRTNAETVGLDFDLVTGGSENIPLSPPEIKRRLEAIKQHDLVHFNPEDRDFLRARIDATLAFIEQKETGKWPMREFLSRTLALPKDEIVPIPEPEIMTLQKEYHQALADLGYGSSPEEVKRFRSDHALTDKWEIAASIEEHGERFVAAVQSFLGTAYDTKHSINFIEANEYWKSWTSRDEDGFSLTNNLHPRHLNVGCWHSGNTERLGMHELAGHLIEGYLMRDAWRSGRTVQARSGVTLIPGVEQPVMEGKADTLYLWVEGIELSLPAKVAVVEDRLKLYLYHNTQLWLDDKPEAKQWFIQNQDMEDIERDDLPQDTPDVILQTVEYVRSHLPVLTLGEVIAELKERITNAKKTSYRMAYSIGNRECIAAIKLLPGDARKTVFAEATQKPLTILQFRGLVQRELEKTSALQIAK